MFSLRALRTSQVSAAQLITVLNSFVMYFIGVWLVLGHNTLSAAVPPGLTNVSSAGRPDTPVPIPKHDFEMDEQHMRIHAEKLPASTNFVHAFVSSLSMIIVSELGDKTFFIAAIMAMRHSRTTVLAGAMTALILMHVLSAFLGFATTVIPRKLTFYASSFLFAVFGLKMLREGYLMGSDEATEEYEEVQAELKRREDLQQSTTTYDPETGVLPSPHPAHGLRRYCPFIYMIFGSIYLESFTLTFLAEWGDRSQITTIVLAARENVVGVILGGAVGHTLCTGLAVLGGRFVAQHISIRSVTIIGGVVFLVFAVSAFFVGPY